MFEETNQGSTEAQRLDLIHEFQGDLGQWVYPYVVGYLIGTIEEETWDDLVRVLKDIVSSGAVTALPERPLGLISPRED